MIAIHTDPVPLRVDETGTIRVGNTRITLDVVMTFLQNGMTPEQLVSEHYPTLTLADVHGLLAYYYRNQVELDAYLERRRDEADQLQKEMEAKQPTFAEVKARLLAKRQAAHAPPVK